MIKTIMIFTIVERMDELVVRPLKSVTNQNIITPEISNANETRNVFLMSE